MQSIKTAAKATGVTAKKMNVKFSACGSRFSFKYNVAVPAGTRCIKIDESALPWAVDDLDFIEDKTSLVFSEADTYGVRLADKDITDVQSVDRVTP
jgi:hypothetical protein